MEIRRGQRLALAELHQNIVIESFQIGLCFSGLREDVDFACFSVNAQQKIADERYMTFYNQAESPCGGIKLVKPEQDSIRFLCQLALLPATIDRLVFTAALNNSETMRQLHNGYLRFVVANQEVARFSFSGVDFENEKALIVGEIYRSNSGWRFSATAQGFNGGLAALVQYFGGNVEEEMPQKPPSAGP